MKHKLMNNEKTNPNESQILCKNNTLVLSFGVINIYNRKTSIIYIKQYSFITFVVGLFLLKKFKLL